MYITNGLENSSVLEQPAMCDCITIAPIRDITTFFSLPIELRYIIYSLILISSRSIKICSPPGRYIWDHKGRRLPRPRKKFGELLLVNKQSPAL